MHAFAGRTILTVAALIGAAALPRTAHAQELRSEVWPDVWQWSYVPLEVQFGAITDWLASAPAFVAPRVLTHPSVATATTAIVAGAAAVVHLTSGPTVYEVSVDRDGVRTRYRVGEGGKILSARSRPSMFSPLD